MLRASDGGSRTRRTVCVLSMAKRKIPFWPIYTAAVVTVMVASEFIQSDAALPATNKIQDSAKATLDVLMSASQLMVALNTALMSAAAAVTVKGHEWGARWRYVDGLLVMAAFAGGTASYYGVYVQHIATLSMVYQGTIYPFERSLQWGMSLQYYGLVFGVFVLGLLFSRMLEGRVKAEENSDARPE